jgi:uncharacterized membrane protein YqjE
MDAPASPASPAESARVDQPTQSALGALLGAGLEVLRTRLDLAAVELEIHLLALLRVLVCLIGAVACALVALAFAVTTLIVALWDTHRTLALLGGTLVFVGLAVLFGALGARTLRNQPRVLEGSLQQLREDQRRPGGGS